MGNKAEKMPDSNPELTPDQEDFNKSRKIYQRLGKEEMMNLAGELNNLIDEKQRDKLTGLFNRGALFEKGQKSFDEYIGKGECCTVIMIDFDNFKSINDKYGHQVGDEALKELAKIMKETVAESGYGARYGGEEFAIFLPGKNEKEATEIANDIKVKIANAVIKGLEMPHTISVGCASSEFAKDEKDKNKILELLFKRADEALYVSKSEGKNRVTAFNGGLKKINNR